MAAALKVSMLNTTARAGTSATLSCSFVDLTDSSTIATVELFSLGGTLVFYYNSTQSVGYDRFFNRSTGILKSTSFEVTVSSASLSDDDTYTWTVTNTTGVAASSSGRLDVWKMEINSGLTTVDDSLPCSTIDISAIPVPDIVDFTCFSYGTDTEPALTWTVSPIVSNTIAALGKSDSAPYDGNRTISLNLTKTALDITLTCSMNYAGSAQTTCIRITTETDPCSSSPCQNAGTCTSVHQDYTCTCDKCHNGTNCEKTIGFPCDKSPCFNGATCTNDCVNFKYTCACDFGWQSAQCNQSCKLITSVSPNSNVLLGNQTTLTFSTDPAAKIIASSWSKSLTMGVDPLSSTTTLVITKTVSSSVGTYYCYAATATCKDKSQVDVNVYYSLQPNQTEYINDTLREGDSKTYECSASGEPTPYISWQFLGQPTSQSVNNGSQTTMVPSTIQVISNATANSNSLVLDKLDSLDAGQYYCVATLAGDKTIVIKSISVTIVPGDQGLLPWQIFLIVLACVLFVAGVALLIYFLVVKCGGKKNEIEPKKDFTTPSARPNTHNDTKSEDVEARRLPDVPNKRQALVPLNVEKEKEKLRSKKTKKARDNEDRSDDENDQRRKDKDSPRERRRPQDDDDDDDYRSKGSKSRNFEFRDQ